MAGMENAHLDQFLMNIFPESFDPLQYRKDLVATNNCQLESKLKGV